jgi:uncharacterized protein
MEEVKNCKMCGKIFQGNEITEVCKDCITNEDSDFSRIRDFLYEHPHSSIYDVATSLNITINIIKHYLRDGRIEIVEKDNQFLTCTTCGKPIHSGWYCDDCLKRPSNDPKPLRNNDLSDKQHPPDKNKKAEHKINYRNR